MCPFHTLQHQLVYIPFLQDLSHDRPVFQHALPLKAQPETAATWFKVILHYSLYLLFS